MSFAYKKLNPAEIKSVPYVANKQYEYDSSSYSDNNIQTYIGEYIPINTDQPFDPVNDNLTTDGNYRRLIYESILHLYYQNYVTKSSQDQDIADDALIYPDNVNQFFHSSSYDNFEQNTMASGTFPNFRTFPYFETVQYDFDATGSQYGDALYFIENAAKIRVISIPKDKYGEGLKPGSFVISGSEFYMADDGQGNIYDYIKVIAKYGERFYSAAPGYYSGENLAVPVGNIFYNHGIAVITNVDYLCFIEGNPVARNDYISVLNTQENKILGTLLGDFDDCVSLNSQSVLTSQIEGFTFPDYSVSASGDIVITPNLTSIIPGEYKLQYTVDNTLGLTSNTASISLEITSQPLESSINSITKSCFQGDLSASITFSIDKGVPPYSWSINGVDYTPTDDLFQPILSASLLPTQSLILSIKDNIGEVITQSLNTTFLPINGKVFSNNVTNCGTSNGSLIVSASGEEGDILASLSSSFSNSLVVPNEFTGLEEGDYIVYFKDSKNCTSSSITGVIRTIPVTASYSITHIDCFSTSSGKITLDQLDENGVPQSNFLEGGAFPLTWSWTGPSGFNTSSRDIVDVSSGSYILNIFDNDGCSYPFNFLITSSTQILYTASINYSSSLSSSIDITNLTGGSGYYNYLIETSQSLYSGSISSSNINLELPGEALNSGSANIQIFDSTLLCTASITELEIYGRVWEVSESFCEDGTGSVAQRNLNFYTNEPTGAEWVTVKIHSGSETPVELATSGSATGSYFWNGNDTLYIDIFTGSNDNFYLRREFSGSSDTGTPALVTGSEITNSVILTGNANMVHFDENLDVSLTFGSGYNIKSLHLTASKINTEELTTNINFKFDRQIPLETIRDNFIAESSNLASTGSAGSGSNFIARNSEFLDIKYGDTGSFIGPNNLLFRPNYAFGNIINTISGSNVEYTSGSIWSGSVSASIFGGENAHYFTQRTDKAWLLTADVDNIGYLEAYSYTNPEQYSTDPIGVRQNTVYTYREYTIYAGSQRMVNDLFYIMIIHEDENTTMPLPSGLGGGEIFNRRLNNIKDVNRIYYLFMSPNGPYVSQEELDNRTISIGRYFIDNIIYG